MNWRVRVVTDGRSGSTTYRLRKNGANANQSISTSATGHFEDTTNTDSIAVDDKVNMQIVLPSGTQAVSWTSTAVNIQTADDISFLGFGSSVSTGGFTQNSNTTTNYTYSHPIPFTTANIANAQYKIYYDAILGNLSVNVVQNSLNTSTAAVWVNDDGTNIDPSLSVNAGVTGFFSDPTNTTLVAANSLLCIRVATGGSSGTIGFGSLLHEVRPAVTPITKQLNLRTSIAQEITKQLTLKTSIQQEITKQLTTRFDILEALTAITKH